MTESYKAIRLVNMKPKWVILDESGKIINRNPKKEELKYLDKFHEKKMRGFRYTDEELLEFLIHFNEEEGKYPMPIDFYNSEYPSYGTYINLFGSWSNALEQASQKHIEPNIQMSTSSEKFVLLDAAIYKDPRIIDGKLKNVTVDETGRIANRNPIKEDIKDLSKFYGKSSKGFQYTDEELLGFLRRFNEKEGKSPTLRDFENNSEYPSYSTYQKHFGSWSNALRQVDLDVDSMIRKGVIETGNQKSRLSELIIKYHFENKPIDLAGENCHSSCDGICPNGKIYDVKSSKLYKEKFYSFVTDNKYKEKIEIYYFLGFNIDYTILEHAWRVTRDMVKSDSFMITKICSKRRSRNIENMRKYEITDKVKEIIKEKIK